MESNECDMEIPTSSCFTVEEAIQNIRDVKIFKRIVHKGSISYTLAFQMPYLSPTHWEILWREEMKYLHSSVVKPIRRPLITEDSQSNNLNVMEEIVSPGCMDKPALFNIKLIVVLITLNCWKSKDH